jgi:hypothetical protein
VRKIWRKDKSEKEEYCQKERGGKARDVRNIEAEKEELWERNGRRGIIVRKILAEKERCEKDWGGRGRVVRKIGRKRKTKRTIETEDEEMWER